MEAPGNFGPMSLQMQVMNGESVHVKYRYGAESVHEAVPDVLLVNNTGLLFKEEDEKS